MGNVLVNETSLTNIANAIRAKEGEQAGGTMTPAQMPTRIANLPSGGVISVESVTINIYSGTTQNRFLRPDGSEGKGDLAVSATVLPANATIPDLKWTSSNTAVATIVYDGANDAYKVHAVGVGSATITATSVESGESDSFTVVVATPTWTDIQAQVRAGTILDIMDIGDVVPTVVDFKKTSSSHTVYNTSVRLVHILDTSAKQAKYGLNSNAAIFQYTHATVQSISFDAAETALEATEETAQEGVYYYGWTSGTTYTPLNLATGDTIPYGDYGKVYKSSINTNGTYYNQIRGNGWNNWKYSMIRQWLNSDAAPSSQEWFTPSHIGDGTPSNTVLNYAGWMNDIDQTLASIVVPVTIGTAANTVTDGGATYTTTDKFFLPSKEEVYFQPQVAGAEGEVWDYYKQNNAYANANDNNATSRIIRTYPTTSSPDNWASWWLRSANRSSAYGAFCASNNGSAYFNGANYGYYIAPACVIA